MVELNRRQRGVSTRISSTTAKILGLYFFPAKTMACSTYGHGRQNFKLGLQHLVDAHHFMQVLDIAGYLRRSDCRSPYLQLCHTVLRKEGHR